jgi:predicted NBD/HSP70 family sugar kinase
LADDSRDSQIRALAGGDLLLLDVGLVVEAAGAGDLVARKALEEVGEQLGIGIANLVNAFNPEMVVLGGVLSLAGAFLLPVIKRTVQEHALLQPGEGVQLATAAHGTEACVMGAVALVLDNILREPAI